MKKIYKRGAFWALCLAYIPRSNKGDATHTDFSFDAILGVGLFKTDSIAHSGGIGDYSNTYLLDNCKNSSVFHTI